MDYVKEAENYLRHYASLKKSVAHAEYMIDKLAFKTCPKEVGAVSNDITGVSANHPGNTLQEMYELQKWQEVCRESGREIEHIEELLDGLEDKERRVLTMWYVRKEDKIDIAMKLDCSERNIFYTKDRALKKFAVCLFGITVLKAI